MVSPKTQQTMINLANSMKQYLILLLAGLMTTLAAAQVATPGDKQSEPIAIMNGYAHLGNGEVIENSIITFREGKIEMVVDATVVRVDLTKYKTIDASGKHVYPGLILLMSQVGLQEIGAVRASVDNNEVGDINPNVRVAIAYNAESEIIPTLKFNGIQFVQTVPKGGRIPGTSSIMQLDAWNWEDALYLEDDAVHLNWPLRTRLPKSAQNEVGRQADTKHSIYKQEIKDLFADTRSYMEAPSKRINLKLEAMSGVITGEKRLYVRVNRAEDIIDAIQALTELEIPKVVLVGMRDILLVKELVKQSGYPVVLDNVHRLPEAEDDAIDNSYRLPVEVYNVGIEACLSYLTFHDFSSVRNLAFLAGTAAAYGLDKEIALSMVTLNAAKIAGIADRTGSLENGKDANIVISEGDLLDMRTNILTHSFIQGREVDLNGLQQRLYEKYRVKYE